MLPSGYSLRVQRAPDETLDLVAVGPGRGIVAAIGLGCVVTSPWTEHAGLRVAAAAWLHWRDQPKGASR
jgi:hypothetical protein